MLTIIFLSCIIILGDVMKMEKWTIEGEDILVPILDESEIGTVLIPKDDLSDTMKIDLENETNE